MITVETLRIVYYVSTCAEPTYGAQICAATGLPTGTVHPALRRLREQGLVAAWWEDPRPADRPRRHYYVLTAEGRAWLASNMTKLPSP